MKVASSLRAAKDATAGFSSHTDVEPQHVGHPRGNTVGVERGMKVCDCFALEISRLVDDAKAEGKQVESFAVLVESRDSCDAVLMGA